MNEIRNRCLPLILFMFASLALEAQLSFGGTPPSFSSTRSLSTIKVAQKTVIADQAEIALLKKQDLVAKQNDLTPIVAKLIATNIDLVSDGTWETIGGDSVCRLKVASPGAEGILFYYDKFIIPKDGKLYIYNNNETQLLGAYTDRTNRKGGKFSTEIVYGDSLTFEYVHPSGAVKPEIVISYLGYCYNLSETLSPNGSMLRSSSSDDCYVDINCSPEGDNWQQEKKGVARIITRIGAYSYLCSGSLVNNVYQDKTPYFLTAHHCFDEDGETADFSSMQFYFHYEATTCGGSTLSSKEKTMVGADMLVDNPLDGGSDGALLRLTDTIPASYDVFYNGWDASSEAPTSGVVIHHPNGDYKKISTYTTTATTVTFVDTDVSSAASAHWKVVYSSTDNGFSVTAGGSSGSPLFNQDGRIVGTLTGGESYCDTPTAPDYFGKFYYHWNKSADSTLWMSRYLNPTSYSVSAINGIDATTAGDTITGEDYIRIAPTIFDNNLYVNTNYAVKEIVVYSVAGRMMARQASSPVNTRSWARGVYIVTVNTSGGKGSAKVIKK